MMVAFESGGAYQKIFGKLFIQDKEEGSQSPGSEAVMAGHHPSEVEGVHSYPPENPPSRMEFRGYRTRYQENRRTIHYPPEPRRHDIPPYGNLQRKTVVHSWPPEVHSWPPEAHSYPPEVTGVYSEAMRFSEKKTPGYFPVPIVSDYGNAASHLSGLFYYEGEPERRERSRDYNPYNPLRYEKAKVLSRRKISSLLKQLTPEERMSLRDDGGKASLREVANALTLFDFLEKESNQMVQEKKGTQIGTTRPGPPQTTTAPTGSHSINGVVTRAHGAFETTPPQPSPNLNEKFTMEPEGEPSSAQSATVSTTTKNVPGSVENDSLTPATASTETSMQPNSNKVPNSPSTTNKDNHVNVTVSSRNTSAAASPTVISNIFIASQSRVISGNGAPQGATTPPTVASNLVVSNTVTQVAPVTSVSSPSATVATEPSAAANHNRPTQENGASQKSTPSTVAPSLVGSSTATKMPSGNSASAHSTTVAKEPSPATNHNRPTQTNGVSQETTFPTVAPSLVGSNTVTQMAPVTSPSMLSATVASEPSSTTNHFHPTQENGPYPRERSHSRNNNNNNTSHSCSEPVGSRRRGTTDYEDVICDTEHYSSSLHLPSEWTQHHSPQQTGTPQEATPARTEGWSGTVMKSVSPHSRVVEQAVALFYRHRHSPPPINNSILNCRNMPCHPKCISLYVSNQANQCPSTHLKERFSTRKSHWIPQY
ncbi:hypothetical protein COOONC_11511 [Cooperia oncophora]